MKQGSLTLVGAVFVAIICLVVGYQLVNYRNCESINRNLIHEYQQRIFHSYEEHKK